MQCADAVGEKETVNNLAAILPGLAPFGQVDWQRVLALHIFCASIPVRTSLLATVSAADHKSTAVAVRHRDCHEEDQMRSCSRRGRIHAYFAFA